jgi:hypothetical protein
MSRSQFDSHGRFTGGGLMGMGGRIMTRDLMKNLARSALTPMLRDELKKEYGCTDIDIDAAIEAGVTQFSDDFKTFLAQQRKVMTPPKEDE